MQTDNSFKTSGKDTILDAYMTHKMIIETLLVSTNVKLLVLLHFCSSNNHIKREFTSLFCRGKETILNPSCSSYYY